MLVPSHYANASVVAVHASKFGSFLNIPDLDLSCAKTNTDICSISGPLDTADVGIRAGLQKRTDSTRLSRPDVDVSLETDGDLVARRPVEKIEVVVVDKAGGVEHTFRGSGNTTSELGRCGIRILERTIVLRPKVNRLRRFRRRWLKSKNALIERDTAG